MIVVVTRAAQRVNDAAAYYDRERTGLGERLHEEFHSAAARIAEHPLLYLTAVRDARKCKVRKFPYAIVYRFRDGVVTIVAFMHLHRRPGYWSSRLS